MAKKKFDIDQGFHQLDEILTKLSSEDGSVQVTICPGYTEQDRPVKKSNFQRLSNYILKE
mgnify:CR=1 FL=1